MQWFAEQLLEWFDRHGRKDLPWQQGISPYRVWISEIMLQQTQVATVVEYYQRFMRRFPTVDDLARAELDEVLHLWTGLGYYARGRNLHKAARIIVDEYAGELPSRQEQLEGLPGIGRSTAGAIRAISMGQRGVILDGNVKRVLCRFHAVSGFPGDSAVAKHLWQLADSHTPEAERAANYTQAIMDLGATLCVRAKPNCLICPVNSKCEALKQQLTLVLPTAKRSREKPARSARFFVISLSNGATLLEQRPLTGLWGGLWNPLERAANYSVEEMLAELGLTPGQIFNAELAEPFRHTFSHYHLDIEPIYLRLNQSPSLAAEDQLRWVMPSQLAQDNCPIGLSAAALRLLQPLITQERNRR